MDRDVLKRQMIERCHQALDEAWAAVDAAPDGRWIADSEWPVRDAFQRLTADCFGRMVQDWIDRLPPPATGAVFSPGGRVVAAAAGAGQGDAGRAGADGRG